MKTSKVLSAYFWVEWGIVRNECNFGKVSAKNKDNKRGICKKNPHQPCKSLPPRTKFLQRKSVEILRRKSCNSALVEK